MSIITDRRQIAGLVDRSGPVIHLRDADLGGVARGLLRRQEDRGELVRLAKSSFVRKEEWEHADGREQFRLRAIAFGLCIADDAHLTGPAAALLLGLPLLGEPTGLPVAVRPGDPHIGHDRSPFGRVRHGHLPEVHRTVRARVRTVGQVYCAVDIARHSGPLSGLVTADALLHSGCDRTYLYQLIERMQAYPGIESATWVAAHADGRCESPLETLGRYAFISQGLPAPLSNVWIRAGGRWFRVDHLLPETGVILEADGAVKYRDRADADTVVTREKDRERLLRAAGFALARYTWHDAVNRSWVLPKRAMEAAAVRPHGPVPRCWTLEPPPGWPVLSTSADELARLNLSTMGTV